MNCFVFVSITEIAVNGFKRSLGAYRGRIVFIKDGAQPLPGIRYVSTPGHSPDHMSLMIRSGGKKMFVVGDAFLQRVRVHRTWSCGFLSVLFRLLTPTVMLLSFALATAKHMQGSNIRHPEWAFSSESNTTESIETRFNTMDMLADDKVLSVVTHAYYPGVGYIIRRGGAFDWVTVSQ